MRLYTVRYTDSVRVIECDELDSDALPLDRDWRPDGWLSDPEQRAEWIARHGDDRFFWPKAGVVYKSRSAAQARADLIESYGAKAEVLVTDVAWRSLAEDKARRERARRQQRIERLREQIAQLEEAR